MNCQRCCLIDAGRGVASGMRAWAAGAGIVKLAPQVGIRYQLERTGYTSLSIQKMWLYCRAKLPPSHRERN